jgi:recombination endonuclease VII
MYLLSCAEYDVLVADHDARCAICRRTAGETSHGFLCIDHDPPVGDWAVRGLLCSSCNGRLSMSPGWRPEAEVYLAFPWYRQWLRERALPTAAQPEPPLGATIMEGHRSWRRTKYGWLRGDKTDRWCALSWEKLNQAYGPHRILIPAA